MSGPDAIVDTNVFVSARNPREAGYDACRALLDAIDGHRVRAMVSTVTLAELRAGFAAEEVPTVWNPLLAHLLSSPDFRVEPVDADVAEAAGELRQSGRLALPDALIVATGRLRRAQCLVTQDLELRKVKIGISIKEPTEFLRSMSDR
ncbi:MAG: PIN domain-containing protein [Thermoplasmata archaeon]|nr:PIN domain-containing protein [Thermoplasmata archaeon]